MANKTVRGDCQICGKPVRRIRTYQDKKLCYNCFIKQPGIIGTMGRPKLNLKQALDKPYLVRYYEYNTTSFTNISVPSILAGHRVKLTLADENEEVNKV